VANVSPQGCVISAPAYTGAWTGDLVKHIFSTKTMLRVEF